VTVSSWTEGAPEKNLWLGVNLKGKRRSDIATWRCNRCGFLESYAVAEPGGLDEARRRSQLRAVAVVAVLVAAVLAAALGISLS
jgi:hypothetical protein